MLANSMKMHLGQTGVCGPAEASGQHHQHQVHRHKQRAPLTQDLTPQGEGGGRARRPPLPLPFPLPTATRSPAPITTHDRTNIESPEEAGQGERETQGEVIGQGRPRSPKMVQSAEGGKGRDKRERIIMVVRSPCQENNPADAHTSAQVSAGVGKPGMDSECASGCTWSTAQATARL